MYRPGPSLRIKKWSDENHQVAQEEGEHERGHPLSLVGLGGLPRENFEFLAFLCAFFNGFLCVLDQISVTIFC